MNGDKKTPGSSIEKNKEEEVKKDVENLGGKEVLFEKVKLEKKNLEKQSVRKSNKRRKKKEVIKKTEGKIEEKVVKKEFKKSEKKKGAKKEKAYMNEKDHKFFNERFAFQSQRYFEPNKESLKKRDNFWRLRSQDSMIFINLDRMLARETVPTEDKESYINLKEFFKQNNLHKKKKPETVLARKIKENTGLKESSIDLEEYAKKTRDLIFLYDKYYKPNLVSDLESLEKKDVPENVPSYSRDFFVKAYPFLNEEKQADIYQLLVKDKTQVNNTVAVPSDLRWKGKLKDYQKKKELKKIKEKIVFDLAELPIAQLSFLHKDELDKLSILIKYIYDEVKGPYFKELQKNSKYKDEQFNRYRNIKKAVKEEIEKRDRKEKEKLNKEITDKALYATRGYAFVNEKMNKYPEIKDKKIDKLMSFLANLNQKETPELYKLLTVDSSEFPSLLLKFSKENIYKVKQDLSKFNASLKDVRKFFNSYEDKKRAEEYRDKIMGHLRTADLKTAREFWLAMGEDPKEISARFVAGESATVPVKIRKKLFNALKTKKSKEKKKSEAIWNKLNAFDLDVEFNKRYEKLGEEVRQNKEKTKVYEKLGRDFLKAKTEKEKKELYQKLEQVEDDTIALSFSKLKKDLMVYAKNNKKEDGDLMSELLITLDEITEEFEKAEDKDARLAVYKEFKSMHHDLANLV